MRDEQLQELLGRLAEYTAEPAPAGLAENIRQQIPTRLVRHRINWETVNIIIDLRLNRSVAAAIIVLAMLLWASFLSGWYAGPEAVYQDSKLLLKYSIAGEKIGRSEVLASLEDFYKQLARQGKEVSYYGPPADLDDRNLLLMHWKLPDGNYRVIFNDLSSRIVTPAVLIRLQAYMLERQMGR